MSPTNLTHLARAALLSLSGWWASFYWVVSYLRFSLSPVPSPLPRSWSFAWRLPRASPSTGALPIKAGHITAPGALSHGSSTCLACPCAGLDRELPRSRFRPPPLFSVYKKPKSPQLQFKRLLWKQFEIELGKGFLELFSIQL